MHPLYFWLNRVPPRYPGPQYVRVMNDAKWRARFIEIMSQLIEGWDIGQLQQRVSTWAAQISDALANDPNRSGSFEDDQRQQGRLSDYVSARPAFVRSWLECANGGGGMDADGDGVPWCLDCDDAAPATHPDAAEICGAWVAADSANTAVEGWHYAITSKFIKAHMHFDPNCVVIVDGCSSAHDEMRDAFYAAGAGAYCGWDALSSNSAGIVVERFLDLLLGQNMVDPENVAQRPFDVSQTRLWMVANNKHVDPGNISAHFVIQTNPAQSFGLLCPTIFRIFTHDAPSDPSDYIEIEGEFGDDLLIGDAGNDSLRDATAGNDQLFGGAGNDQLFALDGAKDTLRGGLGVDTADATPSTRSTR